MYARSASFKTKKRPLATLSLMSGTLPTKVFANILLDQQRSWFARYTMEVATEHEAGTPWPADAHTDDCVVHPDGDRQFVVRQDRAVDIFLYKMEGDLPVYKEVRGRVYGMRAILASAQTFDTKQSPLYCDALPANDATRFVNDAILSEFGAMCDNLRARTGNDRIGEKQWLDGRLKKIFGIHPKSPDFEPYPVAWMAAAPDAPHCVDLNASVHTLWFLKQEIKKFDKKLVSLHVMGEKLRFFLKRL